MDILVGGAWPYANGPLHIGHIAGLLPGDVIARYHRAKGNRVYYVSGSDCYGTPVALRAKEENRPPAEICGRYHRGIGEVFRKLGFSFDLYGETTMDAHKDFVQAFHKKLYGSRYIYEKETAQACCENCRQFLPDRYVTGKCPGCGSETKGDQCDHCQLVFEPENLVEPQCRICGGTPDYVPVSHLYLALSALETELKGYIGSKKHWRKNALAFSRRYLEEGLKDRAVTRALDWGIDVPKEGYEDSKIYIWAENVLGYLSMSIESAKKRGLDYRDLWHGSNAKHYYVHGKDNIPFHTIILPALLLANGGGWRLPDLIVSSEYLTIEGKKISTSNNWAIWAHDIVDRYEGDSLRYYFIANNPEKRDADFSWQEYIHCHNSELLGAYGNFVNRSMVFAEKYFCGRVPEGKEDPEITALLVDAFDNVGRLIEKGACKSAIEEAFQLVRQMNKYYDQKAPWKTRKEDPGDCRDCIYNCILAISALSCLMEPFLPFTALKIRDWLGVRNEWRFQRIRPGSMMQKSQPLFQRLDKGIAEAEREKLGGLKKPE